MKEEIKGLLIATIISFITCVLMFYFYWQSGSTKEMLNNTQYELVETQNKLENETSKNIQINAALEEASEELAVAKSTIEYFKNDEYELVYIGKFKITAYCPCAECCGYWAMNRNTDEFGNKIITTASGTIARENHTIAVDPSVLPYGSEVYIPDFGVFTAEDCGGAIKGAHIDIYYSSHDDALNVGTSYKDIWFLMKKS